MDSSYADLMRRCDSDYRRCSTSPADRTVCTCGGLQPLPADPSGSSSASPGLDAGGLQPPAAARTETDLYRSAAAANGDVPPPSPSPTECCRVLHRRLASSDYVLLSTNALCFALSSLDQVASPAGRAPAATLCLLTAAVAGAAACAANRRPSSWQRHREGAMLAVRLVCFCASACLGARRLRACEPTAACKAHPSSPQRQQASSLLARPLPCVPAGNPLKPLEPGGSAPLLLLRIANANTASWQLLAALLCRTVFRRMWLYQVPLVLLLVRAALVAHRQSQCAGVLLVFAQ